MKLNKDKSTVELQRAGWKIVKLLPDFSKITQDRFKIDVKRGTSILIADWLEIYSILVFYGRVGT